MKRIGLISFRYALDEIKKEWLLLRLKRFNVDCYMLNISHPIDNEEIEDLLKSVGIERMIYDRDYLCEKRKRVAFISDYVEKKIEDPIFEKVEYYSPTGPLRPQLSRRHSIYYSHYYKVYQRYE